MAEELPFPDSCFASGMAILTVHHWSDPRHGLAELRRVVRGSIVVLSWDRAVFDQYWMVAEYLPASRELDSAVPSPVEIGQLLGHGRVETVPVPCDCTDGFYAAWWRRPEAYLTEHPHKNPAGHTLSWMQYGTSGVSGPLPTWVKARRTMGWGIEGW